MSVLLPCLLSLCGGLAFGPYERVTAMLTIIVPWPGYYHAYYHCAVAWDSVPMSGLLPCLLSLCGGLGFGPYERVTTMLTIIVRWLRIRSL